MAETATPTIDFHAKDSRVTLASGTKLHWIKGDRQANRTMVRPRVYLGAADFSVLEDLANRNRRPHAAWREIALEVLKELGITGVKLHWSQRAGCACGCSPGFIMASAEQQIPYAVYGGDLFIELPLTAPTVDETKAPNILI